MFGIWQDDFRFDLHAPEVVHVIDYFIQDGYAIILAESKSAGLTYHDTFLWDLRTHKYLDNNVGDYKFCREFFDSLCPFTNVREYDFLENTEETIASLVEV